MHARFYDTGLSNQPDRHWMRLFKQALRLFLNRSLLAQVGPDRFLGATQEVAGK